MNDAGSHPHRADSRRPARVVIAHDSSIQRAGIAGALGADGDIAVVGQAGDAAEAARLVEKLRPDVVVLALDIGSGDSQQAIEQIMQTAPTPILVLTVHRGGSGTSPITALVDGAVDATPMPERWTPEIAADLRRRTRILRGVYVLRRKGPSRPTASVTPSIADGGRRARVAAIAASTGGPAALARILPGLAGLRAPVLVVQHIHIDFLGGFVDWMERITSVPVRIAVHGERLEAGVVYIGPGEVHLKLAEGLRVALDPEPVTTHRPSADELFLSVAQVAGPDGIGVVLTGMGEDGARGLLALRRRGGVTITQDEFTSAVFGMPRAAQLAGASSVVLPLDKIAGALVEASQGVRT